MGLKCPIFSHIDLYMWEHFIIFVLIKDSDSNSNNKLGEILIPRRGRDDKTFLHIDVGFLLVIRLMLVYTRLSFLSSTGVLYFKL